MLLLRLARRRILFLGSFLLELLLELQLPYLRDAFAVCLEDALLEHTRGEDGEHALAFLHLFLFG